MKLNWVERLFVNSPIRLIMQSLEVSWFRKNLPLSAGGTILEIGCGRGVGAGFILDKFNPAHLYLSDLDIRMVTKARANLRDKSHASVHFCLNDATDLPFGSQTFDAVFGFGFLHHVPHWQKSLIEVARILKTGGAYYLLEFYPQLYQNFITKHLLVHPKSNRFKSRDLLEALRKSNLDLAHIFELKTMGIIGVGIKN